MKRFWPSLFAGISFLHAALAVASLQQSETVAVGNTPVYTASDPVTGRVFVANAGVGRSSSGSSVAVLERDGTRTDIVLAGAPRTMAVSALSRKVVVVQGGCNCAAVIDADTLAAQTVAAGVNPLRAVTVEATGKAYVLSVGSMAYIAGTSTLTEIDLRTGTSATYPVPDIGADDLAANATGPRVYMIGTTQGGIAEWKPGWVQAFDTATKTMVGAPVSLGRESRHIAASVTANEVYVSGHVDFTRTNLPADDIRRRSMRPALFVLDASSLALKRSIDLPDTTNLDLLGPFIEAELAIDVATNAVYVLDMYNRRFSVVDPASGSVRVVDLESEAMAIAFNPVASTVLVTLNFAGEVAVHSRGGDRLDTVPIARPTHPGEFTWPFAISVDASGNAYATNGHDGSVSILRQQAGQDSLVNLTDLWSSTAQPGWGVFVQQQGATLFAALFAHDASGSPAWLVMPNGARQPDGSFTGALYRTQGPIAHAVDSAAVVGTMRFDAANSSNATLSYVADGASFSKTVTRLAISAAPRTCAWTLDTRKSTLDATRNFTSLWWNPAEPGWGLAVSQQGDTTFGVLFGYDASNRASWTVMANGARKSLGAFSGALYRAPAGGVQEIGDMSLAFSSTDEGVLSYRMDGVGYVKPIVRQEFSTPSSRCTS